jgi:hypothetical protein
MSDIALSISLIAAGMLLGAALVVYMLRLPDIEWGS